MTKTEKKYYYDDPWKFLYMHAEFGTRGIIYPTEEQAQEYENNSPWEWSETCHDCHYDVKTLGEAVEYIDGIINKNNFVYIHPDDYHIFEPKEGDMITNDGIKIIDSIIMGIYYDDNDFIIYELDGWNIIQRNNKHFFMPKVE